MEGGVILKKHLFALIILAVLLISSPKDVYCSDDYKCSCGGDLESYESYHNPFVWCGICHYYDSDDGMLWGCHESAFGKPSSGDRFYTVYCRVGEAVAWDFIRISINDSFEFYNVDGSVNVVSFEEDTSSSFCNDNYYYFSGDVPGFDYSIIREDYVDGFNFTLFCDDWSEYQIKMNALCRYLCGEGETLPDGVAESHPEDVYDLEPPLNVKVSPGKWEDKGLHSWSNILDSPLYYYDPYRLWWNQSNIDLSNFYTEIYVKENGMCRENKLIGAGPWTAFDSGFIFVDSVITSNYCNNSLTPLEYLIVPLNEIKVKGLTSVPDDYVDLFHDYLRGKCPSGYKYAFKTCDFLLRNMQEVDGVSHYSNWVWVQMYEDGTYNVTELNNGYQPDVKDPNAPPDESPDNPDDPAVPEEPTTTPNPDPDFIVPDSPNYPSGGNQFPSYDPGETNPPGLNGVNDVSTFLKVLTDLAKSLGSFPSLFAQIFQFLPIWVISIVGCLFVVILLRGIF